VHPAQASRMHKSCLFEFVPGFLSIIGRLSFKRKKAAGFKTTIHFLDVLFVTVMKLE
jgi:hypothetical protein